MTVSIVMLFHAHDVHINAVTAVPCCLLTLTCIAHCRLGDKQANIKLNPWVIIIIVITITIIIITITMITIITTTTTIIIIITIIIVIIITLSSS